MNYALVGAFVLALGSGLIAVMLWLASGGATRKDYDTYLAIEDESVAGLNLNAPVKYNGVDVGKVRSIELDPANPQRVNLLFAIEHGTPIKTDTVAILKTQGLTGIAYVELSGGAIDAPNLTATEGYRHPVIRTKPSLSARLENVLTSVLEKLDSTSSNLNAFLSDENRAAFKSALADIAALTHTVAARKDVIDAAVTNTAKTMESAAKLATQMGPVIDRIGRSADAIETMGKEVANTSVSAGVVVDAAGADLKRITSDTAPALQQLMSELGTLAQSLRRLSEQTERDPHGLLFGRQAVPPGPGEPGAKP